MEASRSHHHHLLFIVALLALIGPAVAELCETHDLANEVYLYCSKTRKKPPELPCCEVLENIFRITIDSDPNCICSLDVDSIFLLIGYGLNHLVRLYAICGGPATIEAQKIVDGCESGRWIPPIG
uniref:Uncharacterized protein n=1 Tax=Leersia perrieri TaxID=77586 RepID=A0A0D9VW57_9ORYZ